MKTLSFALTNQKQRSTADWKSRVVSRDLLPVVSSPAQRPATLRGGASWRSRRREASWPAAPPATERVWCRDPVGRCHSRCVSSEVCNRAAATTWSLSASTPCVTSSFVCTLISSRAFFSDLATLLHLLPTSECKRHYFLLLPLGKHTCYFCLQKKIQILLKVVCCCCSLKWSYLSSAAVEFTIKVDQTIDRDVFEYLGIGVTL